MIAFASTTYSSTLAARRPRIRRLLGKWTSKRFGRRCGTFEVLPTSASSSQGNYDAGGPRLSSVLYECLPSASPQKLELQGVSVKQHQLPNLSQIHLTYVDVDADMLAPLLRPLTPHGFAITLDNCSVTEGMWADVLDLLRSKQPLWIDLDQPMGWEFADWYIRHFFPELNCSEHYYSCISRVGQYMEGSSDTNHLREHLI